MNEQPGSTNRSNAHHIFILVVTVYSALYCSDSVSRRSNSLRHVAIQHLLDDQGLFAV
jgi:hypothetical protein